MSERVSEGVPCPVSGGAAPSAFSRDQDGGLAVTAGVQVEQEEIRLTPPVKEACPLPSLPACLKKRAMAEKENEKKEEK